MESERDKIMADETVRKDYNDPNWSDEDTGNPTAHDDVQHGLDDDPTGDAEKGAALGGIGGAVTGAVAGAAAGPGGAVLGAVIGGVAGAVASGVAVGAVDRVDNDDTVSGVGSGTTPEADSTTYDTEPSLRKSWDRDASDMTTAGATTSRFEDWDSDFRSNWQTNYANTGYGYDQYQPAYRYGYDLRSDSRYANRDWSEFENEARTDWETRQPGTWERFKDSVRYGWERAFGGNNVPGVQTGGHTVDGSPDTRGMWEKAEDTVTGDVYDDKTGRRVA
jgi:hypothetical protein